MPCDPSCLPLPLKAQPLAATLCAPHIHRPIRTPLHPANFELSDYLGHALGNSGTHVAFVRFNQFPEYDKATHEERERMAREEQRFGTTSGDAPGDSMFIVEPLGPLQQLLTPEEYEANCHSANASGPVVAAAASAEDGASEAGGLSTPSQGNGAAEAGSSGGSGNGVGGDNGGSGSGRSGGGSRGGHDKEGGDGNEADVAGDTRGSADVSGGGGGGGAVDVPRSKGPGAAQYTRAGIFVLDLN